MEETTAMIYERMKTSLSEIPKTSVLHSYDTEYSLSHHANGEHVSADAVMP